jgi:hypothetical protein
MIAKNRSRTDRRSGEDRRKNCDLDYLYRFADKRSGQSRRFFGERRTGWVRVNKWSSVQMDIQSIPKTIIRSKNLMVKIGNSKNLDKIRSTDIAESMYLMEKIEEFADQQNSYPSSLSNIDITDEELYTLNSFYKWFEELYPEVKKSQHDSARKHPHDTSTPNST